jgi:hypothetical protein
LVLGFTYGFTLYALNPRSAQPYFTVTVYAQTSTDGNRERCGEDSESDVTETRRMPLVEPQTVSSRLGASTAEGGEEVRVERGTRFVTSGAFYRAESGQSRDLAVLLAMLHKRDTGKLRVLDAMSGPLRVMRVLEVHLRHYISRTDRVGDAFLSISRGRPSPQMLTTAVLMRV